MNINCFRKSSVIFKCSSYMTHYKNESICCLTSHFTNISKRRSHASQNNTSKVVKMFSSNYGIDETVVKQSILEKCPSLLETKIEDLESSLNNLHSIYAYPYESMEYLLNKPESELLSFTVEDFDKVVFRILSNTMLTSSDVKNLLQRSPNVFTDDVSETIEKVNYLYYEMGQVDVQAVVHSGVMRFSLEHFRQRHLFLYRRGLFLKIDRHMSQKRVNPPLSNIMNSSEEKFCKSIAKSSVGEFQIFKKILEHERKVEAELRSNQVDTEEETPSDDSHSKDSLADELLKRIQ